MKSVYLTLMGVSALLGSPVFAGHPGGQPGTWYRRVLGFAWGRQCLSEL